MFQTTPPKDSQAIRLFCLAHAGAGPSAFRGWAPNLLPEIEPVFVELPGRDGRFSDPAYQDMMPLVEDLAEAVLPHLGTQQEFAFFGNSLGGLIAFETLHEIKRRSGREASHLFVSATGAPHLPSPLPLVAHLSDQELVREMSARYDGIPPEVLADAEFLAAVLGTVRADMRVLESYARPALEPLDCPITAFGGRQDKTISIEDVEGWKEQTRSSFRLILLEEGHLYLQTARKLLTEAIRDTLLNVSCTR
jgi:medium-chain acyl-[acyl-carrier-protein] hydrolase